jgi:hypothetical protein
MMMIEDEIVIYAIKACPWCKNPPSMCYLDLNSETWMPFLECRNTMCGVQPKSKYIPIRKGQKKVLSILMFKFKASIDNWNNGNPMNASWNISINYADMINFGATRQEKEIYESQKTGI